MPDQPKRYHTWERVLMDDGQYSMVERDATEYVEDLCELAREALTYVRAHWDGTRQYADLLAEARKLGIVEAPPDA